MKNLYNTPALPPETLEHEEIQLIKLGKLITKNFRTKFMGGWEILPYDEDKPHKITLSACIDEVRVRYNKLCSAYSVTYNFETSKTTKHGLTMEGALALIHAHILENEDGVIERTMNRINNKVA